MFISADVAQEKEKRVKVQLPPGVLEVCSTQNRFALNYRTLHH
jgi:hypothetical protein